MNIRHIKKSAALLLSFLILLSCTLTGAYAQESITVPESAIYSQQYPDAYKAIVMGIENMQTEINLSNANVPNKSIDGQALISYIYQEVLDENPQLFYVDISRGYSYSVSYKNVTKLYLSYTADNAAIDEMKREFESLSQKYLSLISDEMTDCEKALVIHDAIALNCEYDETLGKAENAFNAYGVFSNGVAVCQGYSYAYKYLLERLGIECHIVSSISMKHAWNIVKIDNDYYHVDVTWDDPVHDKLGRVEHTYFLLSDEEIQSGNKPHTGYGSSHPATNDRFDSYFWKNVSSAFNYSNGDWYYTDTYGNIYKGTTENMQETVLLTVTDKWYVGSSGRYYTDKFTKTALHNGYLYYNTPDYVKRISLQNSQEVQIVYTNTDNLAHLFTITKKLDDVMYASLLSDYNGYDNVIILYDLSKEEPQPSVEATSEPTSTPDEPTTAVPEATPEEPTTTAPVTEPTEPATTAPVTEPTEPTTTAPVTEPTEPTTTTPVTEPNEPATTAPVTKPTEATTTAPVTEPTEPTTTAPVTEPTEPTTTVPVTKPTEPTTTAPVTEPTEPTTTVPVTKPTEPTTTVPVTKPTEPTTVAPATDPTTDVPTTEPTTAVPTTEPTTEHQPTVLTDKDTSISVEGDFSQGVQLYVKRSEAAVQNAVAVYDITLQKDGVDLQPDGKVKIKLPVPADIDGGKCRVYFIDGDGKTDMNAVFSDGFLVLEAENFNTCTCAVVNTEAPANILGDVDGDGKIKINDVTMIQRSAAYIVTLSDEQSISADVNKDGRVNVNDATAIQKYIAGIGTGFDIGI